MGQNAYDKVKPAGAFFFQKQVNRSHAARKSNGRVGGAFQKQEGIQLVAQAQHPVAAVRAAAAQAQVVGQEVFRQTDISVNLDVFEGKIPVFPKKRAILK